jgi:hypothetical protein
MTNRKVSRKRNPIAKDLRTPKYRQRVVSSKVAYKRKPKFEQVNFIFEME